MLTDIVFFSNFKNHDKYKSIEKYIGTTKSEIEELLKKNSKNSEFDFFIKLMKINVIIIKIIVILIMNVYNL